MIGILIFWLLRSPCKISKPYDNPFWENGDGGGERRESEEKKSVSIVVTSFLPGLPPEQRCSDQNNASSVRAELGNKDHLTSCELISIIKSDC